MREAGQFHSLSFRVFALRGSQPGKKKKLKPAERRASEAAARRRRTRGDSGEIRANRAEGNKTEEQGARSGSVWILRFPASH